VQQERISARGRRRGGAVLAVALLGLLVACAPPSAPKPPSRTTTTVRHGPTTTSPPSTCPIHAKSASTASAGTAATPSATSSSVAATSIATDAGVVAAAQAAATKAQRAGASKVTVVALGQGGRPTLISAEAADAVSVALATSRHLPVVAVEVPSVVRALALPAAVSPDPRVKNQWALADYPFSSLWPCGRGAGVTVAVVDTGVQANHPDFSGHVLPGISILSNGQVQAGGGATDPNGHGTHVAGIIGAAENGIGIVGVAPQATILPVRVLGANGTGLSTDIAQGITWATDRGAAVVNLSLGSDIDSPSVDSAVAYAVAHGVVVVASAGNTGDTTGLPEYPGALDAVIAVAAVGRTGAIAPYSTQADYVDVAAPGTDILSTVPTSTWEKKSGTSMSAPHVSGLVALLIDARGPIAPATMRARLTSTATDAGPNGFDPAYGWGRVNPLAALTAP
jgi:subtilisin family serine protease